MTPSTENTDRLLEWHPGPADAATTNVFTALAWGARRAWKSKLLLGYLWFSYLVLVEGAGRAILAALGASTSWSTAARSLAAKSAAGSVFSAQAVDAGYRTLLIEAALARPLWSTSTYFVLFFGVIAGGSIAYLHAPRPAPLLAQLGASCGIYLGRFVRLILIGASIFWLLIAASAPFASPPSGSSVWVSVVLFQIAIAFWAAVVDWARVRTVARDSRSMLIETLRSLGFVLRNLSRILPLEILFAALAFVTGAAVLTAVRTLDGLLPAEELAFVAEQVYVIALLYVRLTMWGAMLVLYQGISLERLSKANA